MRVIVIVFPETDRLIPGPATRLTSPYMAFEPAESRGSDFADLDAAMGAHGVETSAQPQGEKR